MNQIDSIKEVRRYLEVSGWTQGTGMDFQGRRCLARAIMEVSIQIVFPIADEIRLGSRDASEAQARVISFNDALGRTLEDIFDLLDRTIARLEAQQALEKASSESKLVKGEESALV